MFTFLRAAKWNYELRRNPCHHEIIEWARIALLLYEKKLKLKFGNFGIFGFVRKMVFLHEFRTSHTCICTKYTTKWNWGYRIYGFWHKNGPIGFWDPFLGFWRKKSGVVCWGWRRKVDIRVWAGPGWFDLGLLKDWASINLKGWVRVE